MSALNESGKKGKMRVSSDGRMGSFSGFLITVGIIIVILMVAFLFVARTEGFRDLVQSSLGKRIGEDLEIEKIRVGFPYMLVLEGVATKGVDSDKEGWVTADEVRIGLGFRTLWKVIVTRATLSLVETSNGEWAPRMFARLGDLPLKNVSEISRITDSFRKKIHLSLSECSINWVPSRDKGVSAGGISFEVMPVKMPRKGMFYHRLLVYNVPGSEGNRFRDVERVWLATDENRYIELERSEEQVPEFAREFWEADYFRKEKGSETKVEERKKDD